MARPTTKQDLIQASNDEFGKLTALLQSLSEEERNGTFNFNLEKEKGAHWARDKNIRDVLIHLYEWHQLVLTWVSANQQGVAKPFLPEGYNWRNYGEMNIVFWEKHQNTPYAEALKLVQTSHQQVMEMIEPFTSDELFAKNIFPWTGGSTLGSYFVSSTASHYVWAIKKIKKYKKML